eukprot:PhF_6_TR938/c0_g1_i2/m.1678
MILFLFFCIMSLCCDSVLFSPTQLRLWPCRTLLTDRITIHKYSMSSDTFSIFYEVGTMNRGSGSNVFFVEIDNDSDGMVWGNPDGNISTAAVFTTTGGCLGLDVLAEEVGASVWGNTTCRRRWEFDETGAHLRIVGSSPSLCLGIGWSMNLTSSLPYLTNGTSTNISIPWDVHVEAPLFQNVNFNEFYVDLHTTPPTKWVVGLTAMIVNGLDSDSLRVHAMPDDQPMWILGNNTPCLQIAVPPSEVQVTGLFRTLRTITVKTHRNSTGNRSLDVFWNLEFDHAVYEKDAYLIVNDVTESVTHAEAQTVCYESTFPKLQELATMPESGLQSVGLHGWLCGKRLRNGTWVQQCGMEPPGAGGGSADYDGCMYLRRNFTVDIRDCGERYPAVCRTLIRRITGPYYGNVKLELQAAHSSFVLITIDASTRSMLLSIYNGSAVWDTTDLLETCEYVKRSISTTSPTNVSLTTCRWGANASTQIRLFFTMSSSSLSGSFIPDLFEWAFYDESVVKFLPSNQFVITVKKVTYTPISTATATRVMSAVATGVVILTADPFAITSIQNTVILFGSPCFGAPYQSTFEEGSVMLSPLYTAVHTAKDGEFDSQHGAVSAGLNVVSIFVVFVAHSIVVLLLQKAGYKHPGADEYAHDDDEHVDLLGYVSYPHITIVVWALLLQGTTFFSVRYIADSGVSSALVVIPMIGLLFVPCGYLVLNVYFYVARQPRLTFEDYTLLQQYNPILRWILPCGRWKPVSVDLKYGSMFSCYTSTHRSVITHFVWLTCSISYAVLGALEPHTDSQCQGILSVLFIENAVMMFMFSVWLPMKVKAQSILRAMELLCHAILTGVYLVSKNDLGDVVNVMSPLVTVLSLAEGCVGVVGVLWEEYVWKKNHMEEDGKSVVTHKWNHEEESEWKDGDEILSVVATTTF